MAAPAYRAIPREVEIPTELYLLWIKLYFYGIIYYTEFSQID